MVSKNPEETGIQELAKLLNEGRKVVLFCGAGLGRYAVDSATGIPEDLPLGSELSERLATHLGIDYNGEPLSELAEYAYIRSGKSLNPLIEWLSTALKEGKVRPGPIFDVVVSIPFHCFVTTNYDTLFNKALASKAAASRTDPRIYVKGQYAERPDEHGLTLYKVHGCAGDRESVLITETHFEKHYGVTNQGAVDLLKAWLQDKDYTFLFMGYSIRDHHFRDLYAEIRLRLGSFVNPHYAVIPDAHELSIAFWRDRSVIVIPAAAEQVLSRLAVALGVNKKLEVLRWIIAKADGVSLFEVDKRIDDTLRTGRYSDKVSAAISYCLSKGVDLDEYGLR